MPCNLYFCYDWDASFFSFLKKPYTIGDPWIFHDDLCIVQKTRWMMAVHNFNAPSFHSLTDTFISKNFIGCKNNICAKLHQCGERAPSASAVPQNDAPLIFESVIFFHLDRSQHYTDYPGSRTCQPENDDDLPFAPAGELEMMMDRCHFEYPFACQFE